MFSAFTIGYLCTGLDKGVVFDMKYKFKKIDSQRSIVEDLEDKEDLESYKRAMAEYSKDATTYSIEEVKRELGIE